MSNTHERAADPVLADEVNEILIRLNEAYTQPDDGDDRAGPADILSKILRERDNRIRALEEKLLLFPVTPRVPTIGDRLIPIFNWIESMDLRVGDIWLHPKQVAELEAERNPMYDKIAQREVRNGFWEAKGASYVGNYCNARVFASDTVVEDHVVAVPAGLDARLVEKAACTPF